MSRKPCQCNSSCHAVGCFTCCDCGASLLGPVEKELRQCPANLDIFNLSTVAWCCVLDARIRLDLGLIVHDPSIIPDVLSEAIEAAEALGL